MTFIKIAFCVLFALTFSGSDAQTGKATVISTNMPSLWVQQASDSADQAYASFTAASDRCRQTSEFFAISRPEYVWNVVLNYGYVYYKGDYYVELSMPAFGSDHLFMWSSIKP